MWTQYMDWSVDDELLRMKLIGGKCPLCVGKVTAETTPNQVGVTWYGCSDNPNHLWEVDYNTKTITPF